MTEVDHLRGADLHHRPDQLASRIFLLAGIYGLLVLPPQYFLEARIGEDYPPAITHPEYFYGFTGVAVAWQIAYLLIARDPVRFRPFMLLAAFAKATFGVAAAVLLAQERIPVLVFVFAMIDLVLGVLFLMMYFRTAPRDLDTSDRR